MPELSTGVRYIKGVGEQRAKALARLGVRTLGDLLNYFPRAYEDRTAVRPIAELALDETACVRAMVAAEPRLTRVRRGLDLVKLRIVDESGSADVTFFNQSYVRDQLVPGESYVFYGKAGGNLLRKTFTNPVFEREDRAGTVTGRIQPLYRRTHGISNKLVVSAVECALDACGDMLPELLPAEITERYELAKVGFTYRNIHFPSDPHSLELAKRRIAFENLFVRACAVQKMRETQQQVKGQYIPTPSMEEFFDSLPFSPTGAQRRAIDEMLCDMASGKRMSRILQGDVGSGKTLVAAALLWAVQRAGYQSAFMAPTEILAQQHAKTLQEFLDPFGINVLLLTGSMKAKEKSAVKAALAGGSCHIVVGTHALLTEDVEFCNLALTVTDEQHRFGVAQRSTLHDKGAHPHILVMSATPIPRTYALVIFHDLAVSVLDELPPGREKVDTFAVTESYRPRLNGFIRKQVEEGHQVFVVCPKVEDGEEGESKLKSASEHAEELQKLFPDLTVACVHGRMKSKEKEAVMAAFAAGETNILVSTTVVEVGVDVPNATLMVVENAERFGLSQLHQLRGRVGRGKAKSYCILVSDTTSEETKNRLRVLTKTNDGFEIARADFDLRGAGDILGEAQHGKLFDMATLEMFRTTQSAAEELYKENPDLTGDELAPLRNRIAELFTANEGTWN